MRRYRQLSEPGERARSAVATLAINAALAVALISGLAFDPGHTPEDALKTFDVAELPSPPPPAAEKANQATRLRPAPAGPTAESSPIVAPPLRLPIPQPIVAAPVAGSGSSASVGAAGSGTGTGAGGAGNGGSGGGSSAGRTSARLLSGGLGRGDYRRIAAIGSPRGDAELLLLVNPAGRVERCRPLRSSGSGMVDQALCQTLQERARFDPAREADGSPLFQEIRYFPSWSR